MSRIGIGINTVVIHNAELNDKKQLVITLAPPPVEGAKKVTVFDKMLAAGVQDEVKDTLDIRFFAPMLPNKKDTTAEKKRELVSSDLLKLRGQLTQILEQFVTSDSINLNSMEIQFDGTGITDHESYESRILDEDILKKIYTNLVTRFVELLPLEEAKKTPLRFKLVRQSKDKHFATIPGRYINDNPFVEHADVEESQSRVKFTKWEIKEGLDDSTPVSSDTAEKKGEGGGSEESSAPPPVMENPFAQR